MDLKPLRLRLEAEHHSQPQVIRLIQLAVGELEAGLAKLAAAGHPFHLEEGHRPEEISWPRLMFSAEKAPNGRIVLNEFEAGELGSGWFYTSADAHHWDGVQTQFEGRGGVRRGTGLVSLGPVQPTDPHEENEARIATWRAERVRKKD